MKSKIHHGKNVKKLREERWFSQEQLSEMLWISRSSLAHIETWIREIKSWEVQKLSQIFDIPSDVILSQRELTVLDVPSEEKEKFIELLIYILEKVWAKANVGKTVLYKLLYFAEFDYYELYNEHISGYPFYRLPMWPAPFDFDELVKELEEQKKIKKIVAPYGNYYQERFIPTIQSTKNYFSSDQLQIIDDIIQRFSDFSATEISDLSHEDIPWRLSDDLEEIDYELVRKRDEKFSRLYTEQKKKETFSLIQAWGMFDDISQEPDLYDDYR